MERKQLNNGTNPSNGAISRTGSNTFKRLARYNYDEMKINITEAYSGFSRTLAALRITKDLSAREMSLSLGQSASYINDIENGRALPSLAMFFEICDYFGISPMEFFRYTENSGDGSLGRLNEVAGSLKEDDLVLLIKIAERIQQKG